MSFSLPERIVFVVALVAASYGFWLRFSKVLRRIRAAKPDADFSLQPIGKRIWDFFWEVLFQAKVIRERPLPGLAHALVFWGFCVFGLITLNHFATALGFPFLDNMFGEGYKIFAQAFGVLVAIGISGLFIRRFFVRPKWLGEVSSESGVIALLIFMLMVTFIAVRFAPPGYEKALWWAHTLACCFPAADPAHQASAPGAEPGDRISFARRVQPHSAAGGR